MGLNRATYFFNQGLYGWTENFYTTGTMPVTTNVDYKDLLQSLQLCQPPSVTFEGLRITDDLGNRSSQFFNAEELGVSETGTYPGAGTAVHAAETDTSVRIRLTAGSLFQYRRGWLMRGLPEDVVQGNTYLRTNAVWRNSMDQLIRNLTNGAWQLKVATRGLTPYLIGTLVPVANDNKRIVVGVISEINKAVPPANVPVVIGDYLKITGYTNGLHINGLWKVWAITAAAPPGQPFYEYTLGPHRSPVVTNGNQFPSGFAEVRAYQHHGETILDAVDEGNNLYNRKSGRPSGEPRGRRVVR